MHVLRTLLSTAEAAMFTFLDGPEVPLVLNIGQYLINCLLSMICRVSLQVLKVCIRCRTGPGAPLMLNNS